MENMYVKINTEIGYIDAKRDAIFLDSFSQQGNILSLIGEIDTTCCEKKSKEYNWYKYCLTIKGVKEYNAINIEDFYRKRIKTESAFSEVLNVSDKESNLRTIIIETYDWAYIIMCREFVFEIVDCR